MAHPIPTAAAAAAIPVEEVATTMLEAPRCHLGEGPSYDVETGAAWWFDIVGCRLFEAELATGTVQVHALPVMASMLGIIDGGRQLIAAEDGLYVRESGTGGLTLYLPLEAELPGNRSNDGRVHPSGALWIGTMGKQAELGAGSIYHVRAGRVTRLYTGLSIPNAICFTPDGGTGYFTDTREGLLYRVALDAATGAPLGEPVPLYDHRGGDGGMDGAVVDADGLIWNARWGASCVDAYSPDGVRVRSLRVPASQPSCPVFVGPGLDTLLVTTAWQGMSDLDRAADVNHGRTFTLHAGFNGAPESRIRLG